MMKRKILLLAVCCLVLLFSATALAAGNDLTVESVTAGSQDITGSLTTEIAAGSTITIKGTIPETATLSANNSNASISEGSADGGFKSFTVTILASNLSGALTLSIDGDSSSTWSNTFTVAAATSSATLSRLAVVSSASSSTELAASASPSASGTTTLTVPYSSGTTLYIKPTLSDSSATVTVNGTATTSTTSVSLGSSAGASRSVTVIVTGTDGVSTTYSFNLVRGSNSSTLATLVFSKSASSTSSSNRYDLDDDFDASDTSYEIIVPSDETTIYMHYTTTDSSASVSKLSSSGGTWTSYTGYYRIRLDDGNNTLRFQVTDSSSNTTSYTVTVTREDDVTENASLSSLSVRKSSSSGSTSYTMSPTFAYNRLNYEVDLDSSLSTVYLHMSTNRSSATLSVSGTGISQVSSGVYEVSLKSGGTRTATIKVTYSGTTETYTVNLNHGSSTASLSGLLVSTSANTASRYQYDLLPAFSASITDYTVLVPYDSSLESVYIRATLNDSGDTLTVDGSSTSNNAWVEIPLDPGDEDTVKIKVTDDDSNSKTYTVYLVAASKNADDDAELDDLSLRTGSSTSSALDLGPAFQTSVSSYTASVSSDLSSLRVYADASDSSAWVFVNDVLMTGDYSTVELDDGTNTITVLVYAEDCETSETYTITVSRASSGDGTLQGLQVRTDGGQTISLSPSFSTGATSYTATVSSSVASIGFYPQITGDGSVSISGSKLTNNAWNEDYSLLAGANTFTLIATAASGSTTTYNITINRELSVVVSNQQLTVNGQSFNCAAYNINGENYFKLRDMAYALNGTVKQFAVSWNATTRVVNLTSGQSYVAVGGEMVMPGTPVKPVAESTHTVYLNGSQLSLRAFNIDGNNYFRLRDVAAQINFGVTYNESTRTAQIDTSTGYEE